MLGKLFRQLFAARSKAPIDAAAPRVAFDAAINLAARFGLLVKQQHIHTAVRKQRRRRKTRRPRANDDGIPFAFDR